MARSEDARDEQFWSARNFGALLVFAAVVSVVLESTTGDWPSGLGGWGAAVFAGAGLVLLGHSLARRTATRKSVNQ